MIKKYLKKFSKTNITKHFGLGNNTSNCLQQHLGLNKNLYFVKVNKKKYINLKIKIKKIKFLNKKLIRKTKLRLIFLSKIKNFKGIRHKKNLPARGQSARTNGKTKKKIKNKI